MLSNMTDSDRMKRNLQLTFDLHEAGISMMEQNLRRRHPEATEVELKEIVRRRTMSHFFCSVRGSPKNKVTLLCEVMSKYSLKPKKFKNMED